MEALKLTFRVEVPPDKEQTETFNTDKYTYVQGEYVGGTRRLKRFKVRVKVSS